MVHLRLYEVTYSNHVWRAILSRHIFVTLKIMTMGSAVWISIKKLAGIQITMSFKYFEGLDHISVLPSEIRGGKI